MRLSRSNIYLFTAIIFVGGLFFFRGSILVKAACDSSSRLPLLRHLVSEQISLWSLTMPGKGVLPLPSEIPARPLQICPDSSNPYWLGIESVFERDWKAAGTAFEAAERNGLSAFGASLAKYHDGNPKLALEYWKKQEVFGYFELQGRALLNAGRAHEAIKYFKIQTELEPNSFAWLNLAEAYSLIDDLGNEASAVEKAAALDPNSVGVAFRSILTRYKQDGDAMLAKSDILSLNQNFDPISDTDHLTRYQMYWALADLEVALGDLPQAIAWLRKAVDEPTVQDDLAMVRISEFYSCLGDTDMAWAWYHRAVDSGANHLSLLSLSGEIFTKQGDYVSAIAAYEELLTAQADASLHDKIALAKLWDLTGNHHKANVLWENVLIEDPDNSEARKALEE
jgi:tetratricopeptide (TPR) repeat protein